MLRENPLFGVGIDKFKTGYMYFQADYLSKNPDSQFAQNAAEVNVPFSEPLKIAIEQGIAGFAFAIAVLSAALIPTLKRKRLMSEGGREDDKKVQVIRMYTVILITLLIFSCFSYPLLYIQFSFLLIICLAVLIRSQSGFRLHVACNRKWIFLFIPLIILTGYFDYAGIKYAVNMKKMHCHITHFDRNRPEATLNGFAKIEPVLKTNPLFLVSHAHYLSLNNAYSKAIENLTNSLSYHASYYTCIELGRNYDWSGQSDSALICWQLASEMIPNRFEPLYLQIGSYHHSGQYSRADSLTALFLQKERKFDAIRIDRMMKDVREWAKEREGK